MDALLVSLRALSLLPPSPSQLLQLLSSNSDDEGEDREVKDLARVLSLGSYDPQETDDDFDGELGGAMAGFGIDRELIEDAVVEVIRTFKKEVRKARSAYEVERAAILSPFPLPRPTALHHLKLRQASQIRQSEKIAALYGGYRPRLIFSGGPSFASASELESLDHIEDAAQLKVGRRCTNGFLLARVASEVSVYVGASFLVSLPAPLGLSLPISIAHFHPNPDLSSKQASQLLPEGTLLAIKEPYISSDYSARVGGQGGVGIRVDTPTDIVIFSPHIRERARLLSELSQRLDSLQWVEERTTTKSKGKGKGKAKEEVASTLPISHTSSVDPANRKPSTSKVPWLEDGPASREFLTGCQSVVDESRLDIGRSLLRDNRPGAAWRELLGGGEEGTEVTNEELELRGDILSQMSAWSEARDAYHSALAKADLAGKQSRTILEKKLADAQNRLSEAQDGPSRDGSTVAASYRAHLASASPRIGLADWLSPALEVAQIPNAGRGLITTRAVRAGEPLLTAKSRGSCYPSDGDLEASPILRCDFENGVLSTTTQILATTRLVHLMVDRPELSQEILGLTAGPKTPDSPWVISDKFEKATARLSVEEAWKDMTCTRIGPKGGINTLYVDEVLRHNAFGPGLVQRGSVHGDMSDSSSSPDKTVSGLPPSLRRKLARDPPSAFSRSTQPHPLPAILNHSCLPNVSSVFLGDVVITRALRDLEAGEEIGHEYVKGGLDYQTRQSLLSKHGFVCRCHLCDLDRADGSENLSTRRRLFAVKGPALFARSDALLNHTQPPPIGDAVEEEKNLKKSRESHYDISESLIEFQGELETTYAPHRGHLKPEMRDLLERIGRHASWQGPSHTAAALQYQLQSIQSVGGILNEPWTSLALRSNEDGSRPFFELLERSDKETLPLLLLRQSPSLHVDEAQRTLWRLSQFFLDCIHQQQIAIAPEQAERLSLVVSRTAYFVHEVLISGGYDVFKDRWGPVTEAEKETLPWRGAWELWERSDGRDDANGNAVRI